MERLRKSTYVSLIAVFAAFSVICDSLIGPPIPFSGVWYSWIFIAESINGIILGPFVGFFSTLLGVLAGHSIYFRGPEEFLFTLGAPIGAMISGFIFRKKLKIALIYYSVLLGGFFATPVSWQLPFWGMLDVYLAFGSLLTLFVVVRKWNGFWDGTSSLRLFPLVALSTFIGLEADVLFRVFLFVPCQTYRLFFDLDVGILQGIWAVGVVETSIKVTLAVLVNIVTVPSVIAVLRKTQLAPITD